MILQGVVVVTEVFELFQGLVNQEVEVVEALVNAVIKRGVLIRPRGNLPRQRRICPVHEIVVLFQGLGGIGCAVRVDFCSLSD